MKIICDSADFEVAMLGDKKAIINCHAPRFDLVVEALIHEKGVDFVLNAIGEKAILDYINKQAIAA